MALIKEHTIVKETIRKKNGGDKQKKNKQMSSMCALQTCVCVWCKNHTYHKFVLLHVFRFIGRRTYCGPVRNKRKYDQTLLSHLQSDWCDLEILEYLLSCHLVVRTSAFAFQNWSNLNTNLESCFDFISTMLFECDSRDVSHIRANTHIKWLTGWLADWFYIYLIVFYSNSKVILRVVFGHSGIVFVQRCEFSICPFLSYCLVRFVFRLDRMHANRVHVAFLLQYSHWICGYSIVFFFFSSSFAFKLFGYFVALVLSSSASQNLSFIIQFRLFFNCSFAINFSIYSNILLSYYYMNVVCVNIFLCISLNCTAASTAICMQNNVNE